MNRTLVTALVLGLCGGVARADWPQWRGPSRDGIAVGARLPKVWPRRTPAPSWKIAIGEGYSSPVVAAGRLYIMSREAGDTEVCLCFAADSGKELWRHAYQAPYKPSDPRAGKGPKSTPTVDGDLVFMLGASGKFHCLDSKSGKVVWQRDFNAEFWGVEKDPNDPNDDAWSPCCGAATSPLVDGERVILPVGGKKAGGVTIFNKRNGSILAKSLEDRSSYASFVVASLAGERQFIGFTGIRMVGLRASDAALLWDFPFRVKWDQTVCTPVVWKDLVIVAGERHVKDEPLRETTALRIEPLRGAFTTTVAWVNKDLRAYLCSPVAYRDCLYGLNEKRQQLVCVDLPTGKTRWTGDNFYSNGSIIAADGKILVMCQDGQLFVAEANPEKLVLHATLQLSDAGDVWAAPALSGARFFVRDRKHLYCYDFAGPN